MIIEQFREGKKSLETCEDGIVVTPAHIAVVDGSTSKSNYRFSPLGTNGWHAMNVISQAIASLPPEAGLEETCQWLTAAIKQEYTKAGVPESQLTAHPEQRLTASAAIYSRPHRCVWLIGDCQCLIVKEISRNAPTFSYHDNPKPQEEACAEKRARHIEESLKKGMTIEDFQTRDTGRELVVPDIIASCLCQNKTFSVIDGFPVLLSAVKTVPCHDASQVILATDGYPRLLPTLKESEEYLARLLAKDPLCIRLHKATKGLMKGANSFDDRAYIRFFTTEATNV